MKARASSGSSLPQMQRIRSSSSPSSVGVAEEFLFLLPFLLFLFGLGLFVVGLDGFEGAGEDEALVCWPLVARPERRGSSTCMPC